jgi:hypothetical protein
VADFTYRRKVRVRHEWRVPGATFGGHGVAVAELYKAISSAENRYIEIFGKASTYDDWLRIYAADDDILLWFEEETTG